MYFFITHQCVKILGLVPVIKDHSSVDLTSIDTYWGEHTVNSLPFLTISQSREQLEWRMSIYPFLKEYMQLYANHENQVIMDYGCGPGNDVTGFALYSKAKKIIGVDVSKKALQLAQHRLAIHLINPDRIELIHISDKPSTIPLENNSVDYINSEGVLHHTSNPEILLKEFYRVLKPESQACIMVYNYESIWMHIHAAYLLRTQMEKYSGMSAMDVFSKCMDGEDCPKALCYRSEDFISICKDAGFDSVEYLGGFFGLDELEYLTKYGYRKQALQEEKLEEEHKEFLRNLQFNEDGYPLYDGKTAGFGGVYNLYKQ
ncbi:class I SAM-dependent methyltransferase [Candidatus Omnitrophota bacterium]